MTSEIQQFGEFDPADPEYIAWQATRDERRQVANQLSKDRFTADRILEELGVDLEVDVLEQHDPATAALVQERHVLIKSVADSFVAAMTENPLFQLEIEQAEEAERQEDIDDFLRFKQAKVHAATEGITVGEALVKYFGGANRIERRFRAGFQYPDTEA
jgi:hypothetical protein